MGEDVGPRPIPFTGAAGPVRPPPPDAKPIEYANLFITDDFVNLLVLETNRYADQWIASHEEYLDAHQFSRVHQWIRDGRATPAEMRAFLGITLNMGLIRKPTIDSYWDQVYKSQLTDWFVDHFNRDRYSLFLKFLHCNDNANLPPPDDPSFKLYKIQPVIRHFQRTFLRHYLPHKDISIDESMVGYKGKTPYLRQYMPNKHHARFGIKLWCLCDATSSYTCHFEVYKGAADPRDRNAEGLTYSLVVRLMEEADLFHRGHHLGLDNYFTSPKLFFDLYAAHTTATGTVRRNRKGLPASCINAKPANKQAFSRRKGNLLCTAYRDGSKTPLLLSTQADSGTSTQRNSKDREKTLPNIIHMYNKAMGGVDMSDARLYAYLSERRTMKWTNKVLFSLFARAILNAYIIYNELTTDRPKLNRYHFTVCVLESLVADFRPTEKVRKRRRSKAEIQAAAAAPAAPILPPTHHVQPGPSLCKMEKLPVGKRRECPNGHEKRTRSSYICPNCNVGICVACFIPYHKKMGLPL